MKNIKYPPVVHWEVTPNCNHKCIHCYNYWRTDLNMENVKAVDLLETAKKIISYKPVSVIVTGGEPFLVFDELIPALKKLIEKNIRVSINTNASLVTAHTASFLASNNISAFVSFPCAVPKIFNEITNAKDSFSKVSEGIRILVKNGVKVSVNMVVSHRNISYIYDTAKYVKDMLGINRFFASRVSKPINSSSNFDKELLSKKEVLFVLNELCKIEKNLNMEISSAGPFPACLFDTEFLFQKFAYTKRCTAGRLSYCIDSNGNIKACARDSQIYGNIYKENFQIIWEKMSSWRNETYLPSKCMGCTKKIFCRGGCRLEAFPQTGLKNSLDPLAKIENNKLKFQLKKHTVFLETNQTFIVPKNIKFVDEDFGCRVNSYAKYLYITKELEMFLKKNVSFSMDDFIGMFSVDYEIANKVIHAMVDNEIIFERRG